MTARDDPLEDPQPTRSRRSFIGVLFGLATTGVGALLALPVVRYLLYPLTAASTSSGWTG